MGCWGMVLHEEFPKSFHLPWDLPNKKDKQTKLMHRFPIVNADISSEIYFYLEALLGGNSNKDRFRIEPSGAQL